MNDLRKKLQNRIFMDAKEAGGEKFLQGRQKPLYYGRIDDPDGYARLKGKCGDTMEIFLRFEKELVSEASCMTDGCGSSKLCGSTAAELSLGKTIDELIDITGETIINKLGETPMVEEHCAYLAAETLHEALDNFMVKLTGRNKKHS